MLVTYGLQAFYFLFAIVTTMEYYMNQMTTIWDKKYGREFLKISAMLTMLCDHIGYVLISQKTYPQIYLILRLIGRIAFPLFCFMLVEGFTYTRSKRDYIIRLAIFAVISEIPFDLAITGKFFDIYNQNVMWTLLIGFIAMYGLEKFTGINIAHTIIRILIILVCCGAALILNTDYSIYGVLIIVVLYLYKNNRTAKILWLCILLIMQGMIEAFAILCIPFIMGYDSSKNEVRLPKYFFYAFYPAHLLILYIISIYR